MKKGTLWLLVLALTVCLAGCRQDVEEQMQWDTKPGISMNGMLYGEMRTDTTDTLPDGFVYVGDVTEEIAGHLKYLIGCKMYQSENHAGYYIYQQMEWENGRWGYVRYIH